ncbi:MAG: Bax inhibitor-1 family protein [Fretibacterium sp.]|nr:Bax inhibitor-1 family protein [Fretibacterium sp.]
MDNRIETVVPVQDDSEVFSGLCRWVTLGLLLMTSFAWLVAFHLFEPMAEVLGYGFFAVWGGALIIGMVGAFFLRRRIWGFEFGTTFLFLVLYSLMTGLALSITMMPYSQATVAQVYLPLVGMFALMSVYAQFTGHGSISGLGLLGLAVALALKLYLGTSWAAFALGVLAVLVFLGLTAWNIGKVQETAAKGEGRKAALTGALAISIGLMVCLAFWVFLFSPSGRHEK